MRSNDLVRRLRRLATRRGWTIIETQGAGSHRKVRLNVRTTVIPMHSGDVPPGTLRKILKDLDLTANDLEI